MGCTLNASKYRISNFSPWFILLFGSVSIKARIHLHSEVIVCDHRLRAPTRIGYYGNSIGDGASAEMAAQMRYALIGYWTGDEISFRISSFLNETEISNNNSFILSFLS